VEFLMLGPLEVRSEGKLVVLAGRRQRALLSLLLLRANEAVSVDALVEGLWGETPPRTASHALQVFVSDLRKAFRGAGEDRIATQSPGYLIRVEPDELDLHRFERLATEGRSALARDDPAAASAVLAEALALWRGDPLADLAYEAFAQEPIARLEEQRLSALEDRIAADLQLGKHAELVGELEALTAKHPYREGLRHHLMLALYRAGRQSEALAVYQETRRLLVDELGIDPKPALQELERAILVQDPELETEARPAARAQQIRLPTPPTPLVGRARELEEVEQLVLSQRLVTVTGPGGIGKTRLALAACERLQERFAEGARFVQLAALTDPGQVPTTLALEFGVEERSREDLQETLGRTLGGRELLLCLDNLEQLLDAAPFLGQLLSHCPQVRLLVTSRSPLRLAGEHEYPLEPLEAEEALVLFADRARAVSPGFLLEAHEETVSVICERLDRLPLAIELAAARTKLLPPQALLQRLERRLKLLTGGARDLPERQQTLRAAIDWSYQLLSIDEQRLFRSVSAFVGGFTIQAAAAVCEANDDELLEPLGALVEHSLIRRRDADEREPRFLLLETIREYATELLEASGEAEEVRRRHGSWFRQLPTTMPGAEIGYRGPASALAADHANLRAAVEHGLEEGDHESVASVVQATWPYLLSAGHPKEGIDWAERALAGSLTPTARDNVRLALGELVRFAGDLDRAATLKRELLEAAEAGSEVARRWRPGVLADLCDIAVARGDLPAARAYAEESLAYRRTPRALNSLGDVAMLEGSLDEAEAMHHEADALLRETEQLGRQVDPAQRANLLFSLAHVARRKGDARLAARRFTEAADKFAALGDSATVGDCLDGLALLAADAGDLERAGRLLGAGEALRQAADRDRFVWPDHVEPEVSDEARRAGAAMTLNEALTYALTSVD
jgi:predicted ATPase/DNA-binding SARP family transcriptional activator